MAAKAKDISHGKENHGKKVLRPSASIPNSPDRVFPALSTDKPVPNYLRHTISSAKDTATKLSSGKKSLIDDGSPRSTTSRRKSLDRPPSQSQLQRTLSSNSREKTHKTSSPSPKVTSSSSRPGSSSTDKTTISSPKTVSSDKIISSSMKPLVEKTSKVAPRVVKSAHHHQPVVAKTKTFKRTTSNVSSSSSKQLDAKGDTSPTITTTTTTTTTTDVLEISGAEVEQEDKGILEQDKGILEKEVVDGADILKVEENEEIPFELPPDHDQAVVLQNINHIEPEHLEENDQTPTEIIETTMEIEEEQEEVVMKMSSPQTEETQEKTIDQIQIEEHHDENEEQQQAIPHEEDKKDIEDVPSESLPKIVEVDVKTEVVPEENIEIVREGGEGEEEVITEKPVIVKGEVKSPGSDNEETKAYKMKFRQRKELEVHQVEDGGSQKLKFKERERLEEGEEEVRDEAGNLILKKQEVNKGKKESQAYNDVIEETASKLVGKRKSKVKALVGAFETVISLEGTEGQGTEGKE